MEGVRHVLNLSLRLGKASIKNNDKLGLLAEVRGGGVVGAFKGPPCYMVYF